MAKGRARDLAKEAAWRRRLARHADSGQSVRAWCRRHRVKETAFHWWRRELVRRGAEVRGSSFVPVKVIDDPVQDGHGQIDIEFTDGRRVRVTGMVNREMLAQVLDLLERRAC